MTILPAVGLLLAAYAQGSAWAQDSGLSNTSTLNPQGSYGQLLQQALQTGLQGLSGTSNSLSPSSTGSTMGGIGAGTGLDGLGTGSSLGGLGTGSSLGGLGTGSSLGGLGTGSSLGGLGTGSSLGGLGTGSSDPNSSPLSNSPYAGMGGQATVFGMPGATDTASGAYGQTGFGTTPGTANSGTGPSSIGGIDTINPAAPGAILPAPGAPDATTSDTSPSDAEGRNSADTKPSPSNQSSSPGALPPVAAKDNTPARRALSEMRLGRYDQCLTLLNQIIQDDPHNSQAHYLKAVVFVMTRHYSQAADEYRQCLKLNPAPDIAKRAQDGLAKLNR